MPPNSYQPEWSDWYRKMGAQPPDSSVHGTQDDVKQQLSDKLVHGRWSQKGNFITCNGCPNPHSHGIPTDQLLTGTGSDGLPTFKKIA